MGKKSNFKSEDTFRVIYVLIVILLSILILFISLARASLDIWASESNFDIARNCPIEFIVKGEGDEVIKGKHYLPGVTVLPGNPWYGFKELRDEVWIRMNSNPEKKAETALMIADKRMSTSRRLFEEQESKTAIIKAGEAYDYLRVADAEWKLAKQNNADLCSPTENQIFFAGLAYEEILQKVDLPFAEDTDKYNELLGNINDWNENQKEERGY